MKKKLIVLLALITLIGSLPMAEIASFALTVGTKGGNNVEVTDIKYAITHDIFQINSGYIEIQGENLKDVDIIFGQAGIGFGIMGTRVLNTDTFIKVNFNKLETQRFTGEIRIGNKTVSLSTGDFPNIQSSDKQTVNRDITPREINFSGNYLTKVNSAPTVTPAGTTTITGTFGTGISTATLGTTALDNTLKLTNPVNPGILGFQNIVLRKKFVTANQVNAPNIEVEYTYQSAFRIIENIGLDDVRMFPNTGAKGDEVYFRGDNFSDTRNYQVYFLKALDGSDKFTEINKATFVSLGLNVNGDEDVLTVKVPEAAAFERRNYYVMITDVQNNQVVAEHIVKQITVPGTPPDQYTVIQADFKPTIVSIYPEKGPDTGGNVEIKANFLLSLNIPDLITSGALVGTPTGEDQDQTMVLNYVNGTYKGEAVSIERKINMQIGKKVTFYKDGSGNFQYVKGTTDQVIVTTDAISDAETAPKKDVVIEIQTILTVVGSVPQRQYVFNQIISKPNGYEFEPSSYTPEIDEVLPNVVQIEDYDADFDMMKEELLLSIKGDKFLVDRFVDEDGNVITRKPSILIKKNDNNTFNTFYQLAFFPNEEATAGGVTVRGIIKYKLTEDGPAIVLLEGGRPVQLELTVIDDDGKVVDGTTGNQLGTKILLRIPRTARIADGGIKHIQVTNPTRKSAEFGKNAIKSDFIEFVKTSDIPVIESVKPSIITVEGGEEIVITGSNLQNGMRLFLDGEEIKAFTRELDTTGNKTLVKFKAPPGREGTTQIAIVNPSGGLATTDFTYVKTFNQNPKFTNFTPPLGIAGTLVVVNGDNFLKPDPTAVTERGVDAYRLIGTRMIMDGKEVNTYKRDPSGNIQFNLYTVPATQMLIQNEASKAIFSKFYNNAYVINEDTGAPAQLTNDADGNPAFSTSTEFYAFKYKSGVGAGSVYTVVGANGAIIDDTVVPTYNPATGETRITIDTLPAAKTFVATMDNHLIRVAPDGEGNTIPVLSDYAHSITLKSDDSERFTLSYNFAGQAILTNGRDKVYTVEVNGLGNLIAVDALGFDRALTVTNSGLDLAGLTLNMITPYTVNTVTGQIDGNRTKVLSKNQLIFEVPTLSTGKGYKDLIVVNPDTKSASKTGNSGFYYITQATSNPIITTIDPQKGSVDGGYYVMISGSDFEDNVRVFVDSLEVPAADTYVALDGTWIKIKMPKSFKNLNRDYGVDELAVPVVVVNPDGGNDGKEQGFTYIIPLSDPVIERIIPNGGSANGGEIVEIVGYEFRFYEPYENLVGGAGYDIGDRYQELVKNGQWDDLFSKSIAQNVADGILTQHPELANPYYDYYYTSPILPKIYFGENEAQIVEFSRGFIKVITPPRKAGAVDVYVINNDSGVSNKVKYTYASTNPVINSIVPNFGKRQGLEPKDIYGSKFFRSQVKGYANNDPNAIVPLLNVNALIRFGEVDNRKIDRVEPNSGLINSQRTNVALDGGLQVSYYGDLNEVKVTLTENNIIYSRTFSYDDTVVYVPMDMLQNASGDYYVPFATKGVNQTVYSGNVYEYVRLEIAERRLFVERGYSPKTIYDTDNHVIVYTPSYFTIGTVPMTYLNTDGGKATRPFTYTNPASEPKILKIEPQVLSFDQTRYLIESSVDGGIDIEIIGTDFRENVKVTIGGYNTTVKELTTKTINGVEYDLIVANVPKGTLNDVDKEYPIMVENEDKGLASSGNLVDLIGPNYQNTTIPIYFVYKKPLSGPRIDNITPKKTSIFGGNKVVITGSDFREGAYVIIGTRAGIPITNVTISDRGTKLEFTTPNNMTLGEKTIQVLNNDYGIAIKEKGITVVSAPTVDPVVLDKDGNPINRIHVTGGQEILIKGTAFQEGAKVYFGGEYLTFKTGDTVPETEQGVFRDDSIRYVKQGVLAKTVTFVDSTTLKITTPEVTFEGDVTIVVRNPDAGITDNKTKMAYTVPIPKDPTGLKATVVDNRYIKLYDYVSETSNYFEIYVYIGIKTDAELTSGGYRDFKYLGITNIEPYKITELPGFDRMNTAERIVFVLKAVNKFGPSGYSNLAAVTWQQVKDIKEFGPENTDGDLGVPKGQDYSVDQNGGILQLNISAALTKPSLTIDLTEYVTGSTTIKRIVLPETLVDRSLSSLTVNTGTMMYRFTPVTLNTTQYKTVAGQYNAYARVTEDSTMNASRAYLTPVIRGKKQVSKVYSILFDATSNERTLAYNDLSGTMDVVFAFDASRMTQASKLQIQLYKYNLSTGQYEVVPSTLDAVGNKVTARIRQGGHFVLMTNQ